MGTRIAKWGVCEKKLRDSHFYWEVLDYGGSFKICQKLPKNGVIGK